MKVEDLLQHLQFAARTMEFSLIASLHSLWVNETSKYQRLPNFGFHSSYFYHITQDVLCGVAYASQQ